MNLVAGDRVRFKGRPDSWRRAGSLGTVVKATGRDIRPGRGLTYIVNWDDGDNGMVAMCDLERVES